MKVIECQRETLASSFPKIASGYMTRDGARSH